MMWRSFPARPAVLGNGPAGPENDGSSSTGPGQGWHT